MPADKILFKNDDVVLLQNKLVALVRNALGLDGFLVMRNVENLSLIHISERADTTAFFMPPS